MPSSYILIIKNLNIRMSAAWIASFLRAKSYIFSFDLSKSAVIWFTKEPITDARVYICIRVCFVIMSVYKVSPWQISAFPGKSVLLRLFLHPTIHWVPRNSTPSILCSLKRTSVDPMSYSLTHYHHSRWCLAFRRRTNEYRRVVDGLKFLRRCGPEMCARTRFENMELRTGGTFGFKTC